MPIAHVNGVRLKRALLAGCEHAQAERAELNRINVFPVPDGDTGTNLALTLRSVVARLEEVESGSVGEVAAEAAAAGVLGARGNCGMILSHFLLGFSESVVGRSRLTVLEFAAALESAVAHVYAALERPVEGTMVTVMREVAETAARALDSAEREDFLALLPTLLDGARASLARTPELLPALRQAGVVDAGAKGFVSLLDGVVRYVRGEVMGRGGVGAAPPAGAGSARSGAGNTVAGHGHGAEGMAAARMAFGASSPERYRYCTEALVRGAGLPAEAEVRAALTGRGDSLIVIRSADVLKVHLHTGDPGWLFGYLRGLGELVTHKAEDMRAQHAAVARSAAAHVGLARRPVGVVTDSACDLPSTVVQAHGITVVPLTLMLGDAVLRDGIDIGSAEFAARLRAGVDATTSQPSPAAFLDGFQRASEDAESLVAVLLGSALSGTYGAGESAAGRFDGAPVRTMDSAGASLLQGLLVLKAAELAESGMPPAEIVETLKAVRSRSGLIFTLATFERLLRSGRISRSQAWLGSLLRIRPLLALGPDGRVATIGRVRRHDVRARLIDAVAARIPRGARARFGVIHVGDPGVVAPVVALLRRRFGADAEILSAPATPVISTHTGVGTWGVAYVVEG